MLLFVCTEEMEFFKSKPWEKKFTTILTVQMVVISKILLQNTKYFVPPQKWHLARCYFTRISLKRSHYSVETLENCNCVFLRIILRKKKNRHRNASYDRKSLAVRPGSTLRETAVRLQCVSSIWPVSSLLIASQSCHLVAACGHTVTGQRRPAAPRPLQRDALAH